MNARSQGRRRRGPASRGLVAALTLASLLPVAGAQEVEEEGLEESALEIADPSAFEEPPLAEGALQSDVFLPASEPAALLLARGDAGLQRARELARRGERADAERARLAAFDDWSAALDEGREADSVPLDPRAPAAWTEGLSYALWRRLEALGAEERAAWRERREPLAAMALEGALSNGLSGLGGRADLLARLIEVERSFPATRTAARAALSACDLALEAGAELRARGLLERARRHAAWGAAADGATLEAAAAARAGLLVASSADPAREPEAWERAEGLVATGVLTLRDPAQEPASERDLLPQHGVRPGLTWLGGERVLVQSAEVLHLVQLSDAGPRLVASFEPRELVASAIGPWETPRTTRQAPGWGLSPDAAPEEGGAQRVVLVAGRAIVPFDAEEEVEPNALVCLTIEGASARLAWAVSGAARVGPGGLRPDADGAGEADAGAEPSPASRFEFQPAVRVAGSLVLVVAREVGSEERAWLCAYELTSGAPAWQRLLAQGSDLSLSAGRFGGGPGPRLAASAPLVLGTRVFAATTLGAGVLCDLVDGRSVWSLGIRRRLASDRGWSGVGPQAFALGSGNGAGAEAAGAGAQGILWDPVDSDVLYRLRGAPVEAEAGQPPTRESLFLEPPRRLASAVDLVGGERSETVVFARSGAARAVSAWGPPATDARDALHLSARERFRGRGLLGAERVLACTERGVYLLDRARELYLLDLVALSTPRATQSEGPAGGDLHARGRDVLVLGRDRLWAFRSR